MISEQWTRVYILLIPKIAEKCAYSRYPKRRYSRERALPTYLPRTPASRQINSHGNIALALLRRDLEHRNLLDLTELRPLLWGEVLEPRRSLAEEGHCSRGTRNMRDRVRGPQADVRILLPTPVRPRVCLPDANLQGVNWKISKIN